MPSSSSEVRRQTSRFKVAKTRYDLIVVGGGIYGATLLWEATRRGLSGILVERDDYAGGASGNSLKIIHGGIRYLQQLDIPRIRSSAREQGFFIDKLPHLVEPLSCFSACYGSGIESRAAYQMAFWSYAALIADIRNHASGTTGATLPIGRIRSPETLQKTFPGLNLQGHTGTANWFDAIAVDTERIVWSLVAEACDHGAHAFNYTEMRAYLTEGSRIVGIEVKDRLNGENFAFTADHVITCTGEASTDMKNLKVPNSVFRQVKFAKAVNIIVSRTAADSALALRTAKSDNMSRQRRLLFFVPWQDVTMIGTWYFPGNAGNGKRNLSESELDQIISDIDAVYPAYAIRPEDITFVHFGRLPARFDYGSQEEPCLLNHGRIIDHGRESGWQGLWSVIGVKYTTARATAEKVLSQIFGTRNGNRISGAECLSRNKGRQRSTITPQSSHRKTDPNAIYRAEGDNLAATFGGRVSEVIDWVGRRKDLFDKVPGTAALSQAALGYSISHEQVWHLSDLLIRRFNLGAASQPAAETIDWAADQMGLHFNWSREKIQNEMSTLLEHYHWWK